LLKWSAFYVNLDSALNNFAAAPTGHDDFVFPIQPRNCMNTQTESILTGYSEREKGAYLAALASLATADRAASEEELDHLREMAKAAGLSEQQEEFIIHSATDITGEDLKKCLDVLKSSDLKYSLVTDLIALAKADNSYSDEEKKNIESISQYLGITNNQVSLLDQFVDKAAEKDPSPEEATRPGFPESLGMKDKFSQAGLNVGSMGSIIGMLGPLLLGGIAGRALGGNRRGGLGGMGGGLMGGVLGSVLGGGRMPGGTGGLGGLGSLIGGITQSRNNRSMGGLLGRLL
jgi:uncharacterized tellurite resistance protein B-like protein